ncbi:polymorphic toxin type 44 domain-containing protein [Pseudomonas sp. IT-P176]|uniref:polymorphic toxin type 44 domain-containing protein n=1 Tax=Pseudomonas sp. IT-P176 TaxID=3026444 RepID=UPI0039DF4650
MIRASVNGLGQGLHGDVTTTGAICISSLPNATQGGRGVLRLGDKTTPCPLCGEKGVIVESLPAMKWMGVATALDGSRIHCGCPTGRNRLIAPLRTSAAAQPTRASNPAASYSDNPAATNSNWVDPKSVDDTAAFPSMPSANSATCNHPDQMEELARYIAGEMNRNIYDPAVLEMRKLIDYDPEVEAKRFSELPWYAKLAGPPNFSNIAQARKAAAFVIWTKKVGQNQEWDHKPKLKKLFNGTIWYKQGKHMYFYDIWSNIHYGYVGVIGGLSESVLLDGAGAEQVVSDSARKTDEMLEKPKADWKLTGPHPSASPWTELRSWDDIADRVSISIGVKLANLHPSGGITAKMVMDEVLAVEPENWGAGIDDHTCG